MKWWVSSWCVFALLACRQPEPTRVLPESEETNGFAIVTATQTGASAEPDDALGVSEVATMPGWSLRIATWNIEWLRADEGKGPVPRTEADFAALRRYAERLDADIVALQEIEGKRAAARVFDPKIYAFHISRGSGSQGLGFAYKKSLTVYKQPDHVALARDGSRPGVDLAVSTESGMLRFLTVHLKSGCFEGRLTRSSDACRKLGRQLVDLEDWVDARAAERVPFVVLGDFNRRFFKHPRDPFWAELDDGVPPEADLESFTRNHKSTCRQSKYSHFIDHIVLSKTATALARPESFTQLLYDEADQGRRLSDHCPLSLLLSFGEAPERPASRRPEPRSAQEDEIADDAIAPRDELEPPREEPYEPSPSGVVIGNVTRTKKRLYHLPGCPNYERVRIDPAKGERRFVDEAEARAAGFEKSPDCP